MNMAKLNTSFCLVVGILGLLSFTLTAEPWGWSRPFPQLIILYGLIALPVVLLWFSTAAINFLRPNGKLATTFLTRHVAATKDGHGGTKARRHGGTKGGT